MLNEICSTDENRIHSKKSLLNYLLKNTQEQLISLKDSIIKLSYSNKLVSLGEQTTKRLPLRSKSQATFTGRKEQVIERHDYIPNNRFLAKSLKSLKKDKLSQEERDMLCPQFPIKPIERKQPTRSVKTIKSFYSLKLIEDKLKNLQQPQKAVTQPLVTRRNTKSYSQILSQVGSKGITKLQPIRTCRMLDKISKIANLTKVKLSQGDQFQKIAFLQNLGVQQ